MPSLIGKALALHSPQPSGPPVPAGGGGGSLLPGSAAGANADLALIRAYRQNGTVFANVSLLASATAGPKWVLFRKGGGAQQRYTTSDQGSDERQEVTVHPALNCLENPAVIAGPDGEWMAWDRFGLFELSQIWLEQTGKCHWITDTAEGAAPFPLGLWPVRPDRMTPVPDRRRYLAGWIYRSPDGQEAIPLRPREVIFNRYPDPEDPYGGCGPIGSVLTDIQAADYAAEWNKNYFINSAEPGGLIQVDHELQDDEFEDLITRWRETHRGVARAHRIAILEAGQTWVANHHSVRDMDFVHLRGMSRDIIREGLGMHKVMTGVTDDVNRANAQTGEEVFANWKVAPRLQRWRNVLNTQFLPLFYPSRKAVDTEFDFVYPTPQNREQDNAELVAKTAAVQALILAGFDADEACATVGLPAMKWTAPVSPMPPKPAVTETVNEGKLAARSQVRLQARGVPEIWDRDTAARVFEQQAEDYPAHAMAWMHHATWKGPVHVPLDHVQPQWKWMDGADPSHIQDFVKRLEKGKKLKPVILVATPNGSKLLLIDGHHRYLASTEMDVPVRAYIGTVTSDHGPWEQMHEYQLDHGGKEQGSKAGMREMAIWNAMAGAR